MTRGRRARDRLGAGRSTADGNARALLLGTSSLLGLDVAGGALAISAGVNTPAEAWSGKAVLAAPLPMMAAQAILAGVAVRPNGRTGAAVAAGLLALACGVSGISGFFDRQLGRRDLPARLIAFQVLLVAATLAVGGLAAARSIRLFRVRR